MNFINPKLEIKLFDTLTNKIQILKTIEKNVLKMYVCGPTVYDRPHLGNARSIVVYDLFYRFFLQVFEKVIFVRNITDVDDKINNSAKEQNISIQQLTSRIIEYFYHDINALRVLKPSFEPKVTENIPEIIDLIQKLLDKNRAYIANNHILFDVSSCADYGKLSNRKIDELISGARVEIADYKKTPLDFVLWKPSDVDDDPSSIFDSPWGKGRPGWHIECSAMSLKFLGENFDIHGGGADLQFPHHENEIAQSCSANHGSNYASYWVHNGFLTVEGQKMSKSLKNFVTVFDLLNRGIKGTAIRLMLLSSHYRKPFDFNQKILEDSQKTLEKFHEILSVNEVKIALKNSQNISPEILEFLADDLNFSKVIAFMHNQLKTLKAHKNSELFTKYICNLSFLGILDESMIINDSATYDELDLNFINEQITLRQKFKAEKKYAEADEIRKNLLNFGVIIEDKPNNQIAFNFIKK
ncbi:MAG: cysteine--tRNA ligase [Proteobacteria bacterium]|nr:cysteine--tRNA ligase [Pseudomonadota bacterium]NCA28847.1 cysteine--tRNA ligase [Pseudomonadota bacterium]